jgi:hypothetical protein
MFPGKRDQVNNSAIGEALGILLAPVKASCGRWRQRMSSQAKAYLIDAGPLYERYKPGPRRCVMLINMPDGVLGRVTAVHILGAV